MPELLSTASMPMYAYLLLLGLLVLDAFVPLVPTQALMITAGALTAYGQLSLPSTIAVAAVGVIAGDLCCYLLGRARPHGEPGGYRPRHVRRGRATRLAGVLRRPGPLTLLVCRFVPGGRMTACFHAGRTRYPVRSFLGFEALAALGWAGYGGLVGNLGGTAVAGSGWRLALVATAAAGTFATLGWALTVLAGRRTGTSDDDTHGPAPATGDVDAGPDGGGPGPATPARATSTDGPPRSAIRTTTDRS
ncbi:DedA family protein [Plantactinospora sp. GCM10030261]|uniref:DedA family protein n=1 Tax=Plantactinospora sp. GCM10030261 TaxID=3273420 RepID=UPI00361D6682